MGVDREQLAVKGRGDVRAEARDALSGFPNHRRLEESARDEVAQGQQDRGHESEDHGLQARLSRSGAGGGEPKETRGGEQVAEEMGEPDQEEEQGEAYDVARPRRLGPAQKETEEHEEENEAQQVVGEAEEEAAVEGEEKREKRAFPRETEGGQEEGDRER